MEDEDRRRWLEDSTSKIHKDSVFLAPGKMPSQLVSTRPENAEHRSKRRDQFDLGSNELIQRKEVLRKQALDKELNFKTNVERFWQRITKFQTKLAFEVDLRNEDHRVTKARFEELLEKAKLDVEEEIEASVVVFNEDWLPPPGKRLDEWQNDLDHFVEVTVPETIENQSGRVTRHLLKAQESFDIDNAKLLKRERRIVGHFDQQVDLARKNMNEVSRKRELSYRQLEQDMEEAEREAAMAENKHTEHCVDRVRQVEEMGHGLADRRANADAELLHSIEASLSRFQKAVLQNFGSEQHQKTIQGSNGANANVR